MNAVEIEQAISDLALQPFDATEFPYAFLAAFGNKETTLKRLRTGNNNATDLPGGVLLRNSIHIAVCEAGNVGETLTALRTSPATTKAKAKYLLATDGQTLEAEELASGETVACDYTDFPNHFGFLYPWRASPPSGDQGQPHRRARHGAPDKLYVELLKPVLGYGLTSQRHEPLHGASGVLLLRGRHGHLQRYRDVHADG